MIVQSKRLCSFDTFCVMQTQRIMQDLKQFGKPLLKSQHSTQAAANRGVLYKRGVIGKYGVTKGVTEQK